MIKERAETWALYQKSNKDTPFPGRVEDLRKSSGAIKYFLRDKLSRPDLADSFDETLNITKGLDDLPFLEYIGAHEGKKHQLQHAVSDSANSAAEKLKQEQWNNKKMLMAKVGFGAALGLGIDIILLYTLRTSTFFPKNVLSAGLLLCTIPAITGAVAYYFASSPKEGPDKGPNIV